jgi:hypothetical protein
VPFEALLGAQGLSLDALRRDPGVRAAALAVLFVEKSHDDASLRAAYDADRERFERAYGEAVRGRAIVLRAARFANDLNPRTFEQAEELMGRIAVQATSEAAAIELARAHNEDADSKARGGDTGWITRGDESVPAELRDALFARLASGGPVPEGRELVGPVRTSNAVVLVWIHDYRPTPTWTEMAELVERELARRFLEDVLPRESVATYLD